MPTPTDTLEIAEVCLYLSTIDIAKKNAMQRGALVNRTPQLIYMAYRAMKKIYDKDSSYARLQVLADYIYWLCGRYALKAIGILDLGNNGAVAGITPEIATALAWIHEEIEVGADGSSLTQGALSYTLNYPNIINKSVSVEMPQSNIPLNETTQFSYTIVYGANSTVISFLNNDEDGNNIGVQDGMLFIFRGARIIASSSTLNSLGATSITVYGDDIVSYVYTNATYSGYNITLFHNGVGYLEQNVDFTVNVDGGFVLIGNYATMTFTHSDEFQMTVNGLADTPSTSTSSFTAEQYEKLIQIIASFS